MDFILEEAKKDSLYLTELRRWFHRHPELGKEEFLTQKKIEEELDKLGIEHRRIAGTGVIAELSGSNPGSKTILLRADIDALPVSEASGAEYSSETPGKMHACGHDAHITALLGAARLLSSHKDKYTGTVRFVFQPGEEIGYGARAIIEEGGTNGADSCFGLHTASNLPCGTVAIVPGPNNASCDWFRIKIKGVPSHISMPHKGVDALNIACQIVCMAPSLITERVYAINSTLIGFGKLTAGTTYNIVASEAELEGTIRAFNRETRVQLQEDLRTMAENIAKTYGGTAEMELSDNASPLINEDAACRDAWLSAEKIVGTEGLVKQREPSLNADDMADFIIASGGCYAYLGSSDSKRPNTCVANHNDHFDIDEDCLAIGAALYARYAIDFLNK